MHENHNTTQEEREVPDRKKKPVLLDRSFQKRDAFDMFRVSLSVILRVHCSLFFVFTARDLGFVDYWTHHPIPLNLFFPGQIHITL